jgi:hypothetical protein
MRPRAIVVAAALLGAVPSAGAQAADSTCTYRQCALNIVPVLHGLTVVRGEQETPLATLGFLWTRDVSGIFDAAARDAARDAVRTRRLAAVFTDLGLGLLVVGATRAASEDLDRTAATLMLAGTATFAISVPIQFRADAHLSRAVWRHNARFANRTQ